MLVLPLAMKNRRSVFIYEDLLTLRYQVSRLGTGFVHIRYVVLYSDMGIDVVILASMSRSDGG